MVFWVGTVLRVDFSDRKRNRGDDAAGAVAAGCGTGGRR